MLTDESKAYASLSHLRYNHKAINHSKGEYVKQSFINKQGEERKSFQVHTNTIEGFWSQLKRGINVIYHWVSVKHTQGYINEFAYRYNTRDLKVSIILKQHRKQ